MTETKLAQAPELNTVIKQIAKYWFTKTDKIRLEQTGVDFSFLVFQNNKLMENNKVIPISGGYKFVHIKPKK